MGLWQSGAGAWQPEKSSNTKLGSVAQMGNTAGCTTTKRHFAMRTETSLSGMDRVSILKNAKQRKSSFVGTPRSCKEASFILPKGSVLATWEAGPSIQTASTIGLPNYFGCTDSIRLANRLVFRNTWMVSTRRIARQWQTST